MNGGATHVRNGIGTVRPFIYGGGGGGRGRGGGVRGRRRKGTGPDYWGERPRRRAAESGRLVAR